MDSRRGSRDGRSMDGFEPLRTLRKSASMDERSLLYHGARERIAGPSKSDYGTISEDTAGAHNDAYEMSRSKEHEKSR